MGPEVSLRHLCGVKSDTIERFRCGRLLHDQLLVNNSDTGEHFVTAMHESKRIETTTTLGRKLFSHPDIQMVQYQCHSMIQTIMAPLRLDVV